MDSKKLNCPSCDQLAAQIREDISISYRKYNRILQTLMELERKGMLELFAGDCPLEDTDTILGAEQHYTVCQYMRCRSCGAIYKNYPYHEPEEPQTKEQLWAKLVEQNKKLLPDDPDARRKLYNHCCMFGTARDAVDLFEEIQGVSMSDSSYRDAIARYIYLGEREKALQTGKG